MPEHLTALLAQRVMRWGITPERFLLGGRAWMPRWHFKPTERLEDAFQLLEEAAPQRYTMGRNGQGLFWVRVRIGRTTGQARDRSKPRAITLAVARALKLQVDE
jgi:hypothetical protein